MPIVSQLTGQYRPGHRTRTLTTLPEFPGIPLYAPLLSRLSRLRLIQTLIENKISTWPTTSSRGHRTARFTSTGIFGGFPPNEEQIACIAPSYDNILLGASHSDLIPRFKKYNPELTFLVYVDSGLNPGFSRADAGSVDEENTEWIVQHHPDWLLKNKEGIPIRSGGGLSNPGEYWPDPGNPEWRNHFATKIARLLRETGGQWNGILFDQFIGTADGHARYARTSQQQNYPSDESYQAAYLEFLREVAAKLRVPLIVNMDRKSLILVTVAFPRRGPRSGLGC